MKYKKTERFIYRNIAGEGVLVPVRDGVCNLENMLILNSTSTDLWEYMQKSDRIDAEALVSYLTDEYEVDKQTAQNGVDAFIQKLVEAKCITTI